MLRNGSAGRRLLDRHRRLIVAVLVALSVLSGLSALRADRSRIPVLAAARDLGPGTVLHDGDLRTVELPANVVPDGVLTDPDSVAGRVLATAIRSGEPLTDVRLVGRPLLSALPAGLVAVAVPTVGPEAVTLVSPGDRVDVLATPAGAGGSASTVPRLLASDALVLGVPPASRSGGSVLSTASSGASGTGSASGAVILAVPKEQGGNIVAAAANGPVALLLEPT